MVSKDIIVCISNVYVQRRTHTCLPFSSCQLFLLVRKEVEERKSERLKKAGGVTINGYPSKFSARMVVGSSHLARQIFDGVLTEQGLVL